MAEIWCMNFGWVLMLLYYVWLILPPPPFFFLTEVFSNSVHFLTVLCNTFQEPKKSNNQRKPFLLPFMMARTRTYEKSLRMFLPKLFFAVMEVGKMVNAAVQWHLKPPCCQVNWLFFWSYYNLHKFGNLSAFLSSHFPYWSILVNLLEWFV